jgi:uncharacterized membrane protein
MGWGIELVYRRYFGDSKRWMNPGFLSGPYLPLYGSGMCLLYIVSDLQVSLVMKIVLFGVLTTGLEYVTGLFFLKYYKTRLWDYSKYKINIQGIITPLFSFFWVVLSLAFYYGAYPYFYKKIDYLYNHLEFSLLIGMFYGVFIVDLVRAFKLVNRFKRFAELASESKIIINYEQLKIDLRERFEGITEKVEEFSGDINKKISLHKKLNEKKRRPTFWLPFNGDYILFERLHQHIEKRNIHK